MKELIYLKNENLLVLQFNVKLIKINSLKI